MTEHLRELIGKIENDYRFECEAGPLANCVDWQAIKAAVAALPAAPSQDRARLKPHFHSENCYAVGPGDTEVLVCAALPAAPSQERLSARWQELFWALPPGEMRSKLRALECDTGRALRESQTALPAAPSQEPKHWVTDVGDCAKFCPACLQIVKSERAEMVPGVTHDIDGNEWPDKAAGGTAPQEKPCPDCLWCRTCGRDLGEAVPLSPSPPDVRLLALQEAQRAVVEACSACEGQGCVIGVQSIAGHGCDGTEAMCHQVCPIEIPEQTQERCEYCGRPADAIQALIADVGTSS